MVIVKSQIFLRFPEVIFGFSTKLGAERSEPFYFNMSKTVKDDEEIVNENRELFFKSLGLSTKEVAFQKQNHTDIITYVSQAGQIGESDAMITDKINLGLAISSADCTPVFLYDYKRKIIAGVHSGWRGTELQILDKTIKRLKSEFNCSPSDIIAYIGPSICQQNYEVGPEFEDKFLRRYLLPSGEKFLLDVTQINYDMLLNNGLTEKNIQKSDLCSFGMQGLLHSYRRDGLLSGRALGVIALQG